MREEGEGGRGRAHLISYALEVMSHERDRF